MLDLIAEGLTIVVDYDECDMCQVLGWECKECTANRESKEASLTANAWDFVDEGLADEGLLQYKDIVQYPGSDWVAPVQVIGFKQPKVVEWVQETIGDTTIYELKVIERGEAWYRDEFLEPVTNLVDRIDDRDFELSSYETYCQTCYMVCHKEVPCPNCN